MHWNSLPAILFGAVFVAGVVWIIAAGRRQRKIVDDRPAVLRAFASRRGFQFIEKPGQPDDLTTLRPWHDSVMTGVEVPAAVRGRTLDSQLTLFDIFSTVETKQGSRRSFTPKYETLLTFKSAALRWPRFEFAAISHMKSGSLAGGVMTFIEKAFEKTAEQRGLKHVRIPEDPGCLLLVGTGEQNETAMRDALMKLFATRDGWWLSAKDDSVTIVKSAQKSAGMRDFVQADDVDRFVDESIEIERGLRGLATPQ